MEQDKAISEARARIIWGESALAVREFLVSNGIPATTAEAKIRELMVERNAELRTIGIRNILIGAVLTCAGGVALYIALHVFPITFNPGSGFNIGVGLVVLAVLYGLWKLVKGIIYVVRPQSEHKSIPDIAESDLLE